MPPSKQENWKQIPGFDGYEASDLGRIRSFRRAGKPYILKQGDDGRGYKHVGLARTGGRTKTMRVHQAVLLAFIGPKPEGGCARHLNGIKHDNRLENLAWGTYEENYQDQLGHGTANIGTKMWKAVLTPEDVREIIARIEDGELYTPLAEQYGVTLNAINRIATGKCWAHLGPRKIHLSEPWVSAAELGEKVGRTMRTIQKWPRLGCPHRWHGRRIYYHPGQVLEWMEETGRIHSAP